MSPESASPESAPGMARSYRASWWRCGAPRTPHLGSIMALALWACGTALALCACGTALGPAFDPRFADADAGQADAVARRLQLPDAPQPAAAELVATTSGSSPELLLYDLRQAKLRWRVPLAAQSRPELLGDLVLTSSHGELLGLETSSGRLRLRVALHHCSYLGATRAAERIFFTCVEAPEPGSLTPRARLTAIDARSGRRLWERTAEGALGRPATKAGLVLVPWQQQMLSVIDGEGGHELARLRTRDDVIQWVHADAGGVFFGHRRIYRLGAHGYRGSREHASTLHLASEELPGQPTPFESAFEPRPGSRSALGRIAVHFEPEAIGSDDVRIGHDRYYFVFYRYVFAYDAAGGLVWTRILPSESIAGQALADGLITVLENGHALLLSRVDGSALRELEVGAQLASAGLVGWAASAKPQAQAQPQPQPQVSAASVRQGLTQIALDTDARMVPARSYAVSQLAGLPDPEATLDLLHIYLQNAAPPELTRAVSDAIRTRRVGLSYLVEALHWRYDFLDQTRPAPLAVIVPALVDAHERGALAGLFERLLDHETPAAALPVLVHGIVELGDEGVVDPLFAWLRLYRRDSSLAAAPEALVEAARGVLLRGGERGRTLLAGLIADDGAGAPTPAPLFRSIVALLRPEPVIPAAGAAASAAVPAKSPALPEKLTPDALSATFAEHEPEWRTCIDEELGRTPTLGQVRLVFIAESDGSTHSVSLLPNIPELEDCLYPKIASFRFPPFRTGRQVASYAIAARPRATQTDPGEAASADPWWQWYVAKATPSTESGGRRPWWLSRQLLAPPVERVEAAGTPPSMSAPTPGPAEPAAGNAPVPRPAAAAPAPHTAQRPASQAAPEDAWWLPAAPARHGPPKKSKE